MKKTLYTLGLATVLVTGVAGSGFAAGEGAQPSQSVTETQTGSQQLGRPATGGQVVAPGTYGMNNRTGATTTYSGQAVPNAVQSTPDAAHPTATPPSDGGNGGNGGAK